MALLIARPSLSQIVAVTGGNRLTQAIANANATYPSYWDSMYAGSKNRQTNFGLFGPPTVTLNTLTLSWAYNSISTQTFTVSCNHSKWKFHNTSVATGFTVAVYSTGNTVFVGNYDTTTLFDSGMTIRVTPQATNSGSVDKVCTLIIGTYNNYILADGTMTGTQVYLPIAPTISFEPTGMTLSNTSYTITTGSASVTINWTPSGMATSPHINYIIMTKSGPTTVYSGSKSACVNNATQSFTFNISPAAENGVNYTVYINYDNA